MKILEHVIGWLLPAPVSAAPIAPREPDNILEEIERDEARAAATQAAQPVASEAAQPAATEWSPCAEARCYGHLVAHSGGSVEPSPAYEIGIEKTAPAQFAITPVYVRCPFCQSLHVHGWPMSTPPTLSIIRDSDCTPGGRYRVVGLHDPQRGHPGGPAASGPIARVA